MNSITRYLAPVLFALSSLTCTTATAKTTIKVGYLPILDHLPLLVSHAQDDTKFQAVKIEPRMFKGWNTMVGALKADVINAAFILSPLAIDLFNQGVNIKTVLLAHRDGSAITVKKNSSIRSPADLKGKVIAIPAQKATHTALLNKYLMGAQLSLKDVITKVVAPPNMIRAMKMNRIDAFIVAEPFGAKAQSSGVGKILVLTKDIVPNHVECIVVVKQDMIEQHPEAVQEWVDSLLRVGRWIDKDKTENNAEQTARLSVKYLPHSQRSIINGLENPKDRISFTDLNPNKADFQTIVDIAVQAHLINKVNLDAFIDRQFYLKSSQASKLR